INIIGLGENKPVFIEGDPDMIHQVVYNLVENATKFTNIEGRIDVAIEDKNTDVWVSITNTGPGIPPEQIGYIFDRFYKTDKSRSMDKNGMGLGLFIVKTIIQLHGGEISAESEEGKYTRFKFRLPKKTENEKKRSLK
ncbi:MAG: ATP-binding protein, partial [Clostridia bacterium]|nr:ATP-binding protein [Clostridia bacterium]